MVGLVHIFSLVSFLVYLFFLELSLDLYDLFLQELDES